MIAGFQHRILLQSSIVFIALACMAMIVKSQEANTCDGLPGSCSNDAFSLLQQHISISQQDGHSERSNGEFLSRLSPLKRDNHKDDYEEHVGTCFVPVDKEQVHYQSWALSEPEKGGPKPKDIFKFNAVQSLGMYNPSIVELPASLKQGAAKFAMALRRDADQCQRLVREVSGNLTAVSAPSVDADSVLLILDANYCVLSQSLLTLSGAVRHQAQDVRLFVDASNLYASFVLWQRDSNHSSDTGDIGEGLWFAPVKIDQVIIRLGGYEEIDRPGEDSLLGLIDHSQAIRLGGYEEKNYGLFKQQSKLMALTWLDAKSKRPETETLQQILKEHEILPASAKAVTWHNNVNLLWLEDSGEFLGIMHEHIDTSTNFDWGSDYKHRFFKLSAKPPYALTAQGQEFCIRNVNGKCESVQMVMSMMQTSKDEVVVSYGINDCEARFATFSLSSILEQLSTMRKAFPVDVMQVSERQIFTAKAIDQLGRQREEVQNTGAV